jgi:putative endonuclease
MHYIYIIECADGTLYTGYTNQLEKRIISHNSGKGAKYTRGRTPVILKYDEELESKQEAMRREAQIKKLTRNEKLELINKK